MKPAYAEAASLLKDQSVSMITIHSDVFFYVYDHDLVYYIYSALGQITLILYW